tara:strand:+ start:133 stop:375 length:243 start_codon:yes stop_codon:yes gene_type:complete
MSDIITKQQQVKVDIISRQTDNIEKQEIITLLKNNDWDTIKTLKNIYNIENFNLKTKTKPQTTDQMMFAAFRNILQDKEN